MFPQILIQSLLSQCESLIIGRKKLLFTLRLKIFEGHGYLALIGRLMWYFAKLVGETCLLVILVKFIYSEKATKFYEISTVDLTVTTYIGQIYSGDFAKFCSLLRIHEL
jgi:hypothetical protein